MLTRIFSGVAVLLIAGVASACGEARSDAIWKEVAGTNDLLRGNMEGAVRKLRESVSADPTYTAAHTNLGLALIESSPQDFAAAKEQFSLAIHAAEARPSVSSLLPFLDTVFHRDRPRYDSGVRLISLAASNNIGAAQLSLGQFDEARETLQAAIDRYYDSSRKIEGFGNQSARDYAGIEFNQGQAYAGLAQTTEKPGLYAKAIDHYSRAIEALRANKILKTFPDPYFWRAAARLGRGGGNDAAKTAYDDYKSYVALGGMDPLAKQYIDSYKKSEDK